MKTTPATNSSLHFIYLPSYAHYLLEQKLDDFIQAQRVIAEQLQIPLLQAFKKIADEDLKAYETKNTAELLNSLINNQAETYIKEAIKKWVSNTLPHIDKHQVVAEDLSLISFARKKAFLQFLPTFCVDAEQMILIIEELDFFLTKLNAAATETYVSLLHGKIEEHMHFIEKINSASPSAIYVVDIEDQKMIYANSKFNEVLGLSITETSGFDVSFFNTVIHPDDLDTIKSHYQSFGSIADKEIKSCKYRIRNKEGAYRWMRNYDTVFKRKDDQTVLQVIGVVIDVTKEKTTADELRRREEQLTEAQALAHIGSWSCTLETETFFWSDEMYRIFQVDKSTQLTLQFISSLTHPDDIQYSYQQIKKALKSKKATEFQLRIITAGNTIKFINATVEVIIDNNDKPIEVLGTVQDITEKQKLLNELKRNESLYQQAETLANLGNWVWNKETDQLKWTDQLYRIYGLTPQAEEITMDRFLSFIHPDDSTRISQMIYESGTDLTDHTFKIITAKGEVKTLHSVAQIHRDSKGNVTQIIGTEQDFTEQQNLIQRLQQSESLYKQAQSIAHIGNWSLDLMTYEITWSDEMYNIYELDKREEISIGNWVSSIHPDDKEDIMDYWKDRLQDKQPYDKIHRIILSNGQVKILHRKGAFVFNNKGEAIKVVGTTQDITKQYQAQNELKEKQTFIQKITDATPSIITSYHVNTDRYVFVNEGLQKLLGYAPSDAIGKGASFFTDIVHPDDVENLIQRNYAALVTANAHPEESKIEEFTYRMRHKDGSFKWFHTYATVFDRNSSGQVEHVLRISLDVSEQIAARKKIEEQELFIKQVADASPTILYLYDTVDNRFTYVNKEIFYVLGYSPEEIIELKDKVTAELYHPEDLPLLPERPQSNKRFQHANIMIQYECRLKNKDGKWSWLLIREVVFQQNEEGRPNQILGAALDITKRKEMEKSLVQNSFQLQQSNASLEEFAYVASHDLKEPLRKISTFGDRIIQTQQDRLSEDGKIYLKKIIDASQRMQVMINDLLSISMITGDRTFQPSSLQAIFDEVKQTLEHKIEKQNAIIEAHQLPEANIIASQFRQLFQNLLSNSLKFTREGIQPHIKVDWKYVSTEELNTISHAKATRYLQFDFIDNGIGFEEEYAGKIFQIFQRLHGRSEYEGTGIGLAICKKIIEHHEGSIQAHGYEGKGATFTILLPA